MKITLFLFLVSFSSLSFSNEDLQRANVIQAIENSLASKDLECITYANGRTKKSKASDLKLSRLKSPIYKMTINETEQPVITFKAVDDQFEVVTTIVTNSELTVVVGIDTVSSEFTNTKVNIGTITKPIFEKRILKEDSVKMNCK